MVAPPYPLQCKPKRPRASTPALEPAPWGNGARDRSPRRSTLGAIDDDNHFFSSGLFHNFFFGACWPGGTLLPPIAGEAIAKDGQVEGDGGKPRKLKTTQGKLAPAAIKFENLKNLLSQAIQETTVWSRKQPGTGQQSDGWLAGVPLPTHPAPAHPKRIDSSQPPLRHGLVTLFGRGATMIFVPQASPLTHHDPCREQGAGGLQGVLYLGRCAVS